MKTFLVEVNDCILLMKRFITTVAETEEHAIALNTNICSKVISIKEIDEETIK